MAAGSVYNERSKAVQKSHNIGKHAMENIQNAMQNLNNCMGQYDKRLAVPFERFIKILVQKPDKVLRNVFQIFHDMVKTYVAEGIDEYPDDPESIDFINYDFSRLLVKDADRPFFADRLFANRLMSHTEAMKSGSQQNWRSRRAWTST